MGSYTLGYTFFFHEDSDSDRHYLLAQMIYFYYFTSDVDYKCQNHRINMRMGGIIFLKNQPITRFHL